MRWLLTIFSLLQLSPVFSQESAAILSKELVASSTTELEKVTAIFQWITDNISYKVRQERMPVIGAVSLRNSININNNSEDDFTPLKPLNERVSEAVLKKKETVCDGFARLFKTLCDYAGIQSAIIMGYAKSDLNKPVERFGVNHYWNGVMIDGKWHLLDATWASGYISARRQVFVRDYDGKYFLTAPEIFIEDHYPDDARWTLLDDTKMPKEFYSSPFKQKSFSKYSITSFFPACGVIETFIGDTIRLSLETAIAESGRNISPDMLIDSAIFTHSDSWVFIEPDLKERGKLQKMYNYIYTVASPEVQWLYLLYNKDLVLRYKVNVKK